MKINGTDKQVTWARDILEKFTLALDTRIISLDNQKMTMVPKPSWKPEEIESCLEKRRVMNRKIDIKTCMLKNVSDHLQSTDLYAGDIIDAENLLKMEDLEYVIESGDKPMVYKNLGINTILGEI